MGAQRGTVPTVIGVAHSARPVLSVTSATLVPGPPIATARFVGIARHMRRVAAVCLAIGPVACLASPPPPGGEGGGPDAAPVFSVCGNAQIDVAYMSRFTIDPDSYGRVGLDRIGLVINSGAGLLDLSSLEVLGASVDDDYSTLTFEAYDNQGPPVEPGEARGELRSSGRDMVLAQVEEDWTDPYSPEISGMLITARSQGELRGTL